jgi:hypothetical protein
MRRPFGQRSHKSLQGLRIIGTNFSQTAATTVA